MENIKEIIKILEINVKFNPDISTSHMATKFENISNYYIKDNRVYLKEHEFDNGFIIGIEYKGVYKTPENKYKVLDFTTWFGEKTTLKKLAKKIEPQKDKNSLHIYSRIYPEKEVLIPYKDNSNKIDYNSWTPLKKDDIVFENPEEYLKFTKNMLKLIEYNYSKPNIKKLCKKVAIQ